MTTVPDQQPTALRRSIRLPQATAMVVGIIIGASIFLQPSDITRLVPSVKGILLVWFVAGLLTFIGALASAELASAFPETGGVYVFLTRAFSPAFGFLWGWAMFWSMHSGIVAAIAYVFARYAAYLLHMDEGAIRYLAIGGVMLLSGINCLGVKFGAGLQTAFTVVKVLAIVLATAAAFAFAPETPPPALIVAKAVEWQNVIVAIAAGLFAYGGWHMVTYVAGETVEPQKTIPRALFLGTLTVTVCYIALNAAYLHVLPLDQVQASKRIAADAANVVMGPGGAVLMASLVVFSAFGALNGVILAGPRVYYAMARDGLAFDWLGKSHPRFQTPQRALLLQAFWSSVLILLFDFADLVMSVVYTEWIFFALMVFGIFVLRRRADYAPAYRMWGYPVAPVIFIVASLVIVVVQVAEKPVPRLMGFGLVALGLPIYYFWQRSRANSGGNLTEGPAP